MDYNNIATKLYSIIKMIEIPKQLHNDNFKFVLLHKYHKRENDLFKACIESGWTSYNNYRYDNEYLNGKLKEGHNYGVMCGTRTKEGTLLVVDFDQRKLQTELMKIFPKTFTVKTATKGLYHVYYYIDRPFRKFGLKNHLGETVLDFQCLGSQVVGPNSMNPDTNKYQIIRDTKIAKISYDYLSSIFGNVFKDRLRRRKSDTFKGEKGTLVKVMEHYKVDIVSNIHAICPLHESKGKRNLAYNNSTNYWTCFSCGKSGTPLDMIKYIESCNEKEAQKRLDKISVGVIK